MGEEVVFTRQNQEEEREGAVNFLTGEEPLGALWALFGSEVEGAAMPATVMGRSTGVVRPHAWSHPLNLR